MKKFRILIIAAMLGLVVAGCSQDEKMIGYAGPIEKTTLNNNNFRQVLFTGKHSQLVVMSLQPGEEIGREMHKTSTSFSASNRVMPSSSLVTKKNSSQVTATRWWCLLVPITMLSTCLQRNRLSFIQFTLRRCILRGQCTKPKLKRPPQNIIKI